MNTGNRDLPTAPAGDDGRDPIAQLLASVDPRPPLAEERRERVRETVHGQWLDTLKSRRRQRTTVLVAGLAAALILAVTLTPAARERLSAYFEPAFEGPVAQVAVIRGLVWQAPRGASDQFPGSRLTADTTVEAGMRVETTEESRVALELLDGRSVRLDHSTQIRFETPTRLVLDRGAVYVDSGLGEVHATRIEVVTPFGSVFDIGTQFEVRQGDEELRVRVREGLVNLSRAGEAVEAGAGVELAVGAEGEISRRTVGIHGPIWDWVLEVAPAFTLEGSSLPTFLAWVARETGREIRFESAATEASAAEVIVHGSVEGMRPDAALEAVLPTCGLTHRSAGDTWLLEPLVR